MASLREIRTHITGVQKTQQITRALKMVAAVKLRHAQENLLQAVPYSERIKEVIGHISNHVEKNFHPLLAIREPKRIGYIIVTADQGLCGSFNQNIIRRAELEIRQHPEQDIFTIVIGKRGWDYFKKSAYRNLSNYTGFFKDLNFVHASTIASLIMDFYITGSLDQFLLIYNEFKSATNQNVVVEQLLPIQPVAIRTETKVSELLLEPNKIGVVENVCLQYLNVYIWRVLLESFASEMAARMTAMEYATENAETLLTDLKTQFNRRRQENITNEILEIVGGSEVLREK